MNIPMQFKNFKWRSNPSEIEIKCEDNIKKMSVPYGVYILQNYGKKPITLRGKGEFIGEYAKSDFDELKSVFDEGTDGILMMCGIKPMTAIMNELTLLGGDNANHVTYAFEFTEVPFEESEPCNFKKYVSVESGKNLWNISVEYDIPIEELLELNPEIMHPWDVATGDEVRIS